MRKNDEQLVKIIDFWQKSVEKDQLRVRPVVDEIDFKSKEIIDLVGPRRSGKSSVLKLLIKKMKIEEESLYINFEDPFFIGNNGPEVVEELIAVFLEYFSPNLRFLFFDEIQEIDHWEKAVRKLRDGEDFKIFVTGSSSKLLSGEISSLITGRHLSYNIFPLSFREFLDFKKIRLERKKDLVLQGRRLRSEFAEYMEIGGFPEVVISGSKELLKNYFYDILQKDVVKRHEVRERDVLEKMAVFLLSNSGKIVTIESLKKQYNLSFETVSLYLEYLKDSFLIFELRQFSYSLKKQNKAWKKNYAVDAGLANNVSFRFSQDKGRILETIVFLELRKRYGEFFYFKNSDDSEVDFLVREKNVNKQLIQVAWELGSEETKNREIESLRKAMRELKLKQGTILTNDEDEELSFDEGRITVKPVYKWLIS